MTTPTNKVAIVGAGLAGSEAALQLADRAIAVDLYEMRPAQYSEVHRSDFCAELVCSNSLKSTKPESAAGMLKEELRVLESHLYECALNHRVSAGGALAVDRDGFSAEVTHKVENHPNIKLIRREVRSLRELASLYDAIVLATGPLTSPELSEELIALMGEAYFSFYDAAAPIVMADSLDTGCIFSQNRYEDSDDSGTSGDYLNAPMDKECYENFIKELTEAKRVIAKDFEQADLFQACQPVEEVAKTGIDSLRYGALKPVGLIDPHTGRRPYAVVQLRPENEEKTAYNLVGFQTNLTFSEQQRVFSLIPGLSQAEFVRFGVMHKNTFINAPALLDRTFRLNTNQAQGFDIPVYVAGQLSGTEGYVEAMRGGIHAALAVSAHFKGVDLPELPKETVFGALVAYASNPETKDYQPMHVNFGIIEPLEKRIRNKGQRYQAYAERGRAALYAYRGQLEKAGLMKDAEEYSFE